MPFDTSYRISEKNLSVERRLKGDMEKAPIQVDIGDMGKSMCEQR